MTVLKRQDALEMVVALETERHQDMCKEALVQKIMKIERPRLMSLNDFHLSTELSKLTNGKFGIEREW